jgi:hypothetical protein
MKRSYYLIAAVGLTVLIVGYRLCRHEDKSAPSLPMPTDTTRDEPNTLPPLPTIPEATLPPVAAPVDAPLAIPTPGSESPETPAQPAASAVVIPAVTEIPTIPTVPSPGSTPEMIPLGGIADAPPLPSVPSTPSAIVQNPVLPAPPAQPTPSAGVGAANPVTVLPIAPDASLKPTSRYLVLRGKPGQTTPANQLIVELMACKLMAIEGIVGQVKGDLKVQQGAIERLVKRADVVFAGDTSDEVYHFMRDRAPQTDAISRLVVARWCMLQGLREQALAEGREVLKLQPGNKSAVELTRSLEESIRQFPTEGGAVKAVTTTRTVSVVEPEVEIPPEAATTFATRLQPILANLCVDCHARADHAGSFKMARVSGFDAGPQATQVNLRATVAQLSKTDPANSPLLVKAITAHGGLKQPPFISRQAPGFRTLELWAALALSSSTQAAVAAPLTQTGTQSPSASSEPPPVPQPITLPAVPASSPMSAVPSTPALPAVLPTVSVPVVLPTPPTMTPAVPTMPPLVPPPAAAPIPPAAPMGSSTAPTGGNPVKQAGGVSSGGSQFGISAPPRPLPPSVTGGDEFDPSNFNKGK